MMSVLNNIGSDTSFDQMSISPVTSAMRRREQYKDIPNPKVKQYGFPHGTFSMNERAKIARRVADEAEETKTVLAAYEDEHFKTLTARLFADRAVEAVSRLEHLTVEDLCAMTSCEVRVKDAGTRRMLDTEGPYLLDLRIRRDQNVFPMMAPDGSIIEAADVISEQQDAEMIVFCVAIRACARQVRAARGLDVDVQVIHGRHLMSMVL